MNKAFTREVDREDDDDDDVAAAVLPQGAKNYITVAGYRRLRQELMTLLDEERPKVVEVVSWAAKNGHDAVVKLLLETGNVDVDSKDSEYGRTPLSWAAWNGRKAVVKLLERTQH